MITIIATVEVKEGKMEEAKEVLKNMVPQIKASELGTLEYIPHTVKGREFKNTIIFYEKYEDGEAFKTHMANLAKTGAKLTPLLVPGMDLKTCFEIV
ncbi:MAG: antibiotic biosynthesis monooxygenase [Candidatus Lokiarchaeota archaeon]|nr:antibiotic biosynthesis monooxygenase [Candidatus Lokiarchaeota archaeon]